MKERRGPKDARAVRFVPIGPFLLTNLNANMENPSKFDRGILVGKQGIQPLHASIVSDIIDIQENWNVMRSGLLVRDTVFIRFGGRCRVL